MHICNFLKQDFYNMLYSPQPPHTSVVSTILVLQEKLTILVLQEKLTIFVLQEKPTILVL